MDGIRHSLARVLAAVINAQEQEGARVARLLHDDVGQTLSAVGLHLDVLRMDVEETSPDIAQRINETQKLLERVVEQVRALSYELNPGIVERAGLHTAMERLVGKYREITLQSIRLLYDSTIRPPTKVAGSLYKIAECALDNAARHSGAKRIEVFVRPGRTGGIVLEVKDDGAGFDRKTVELEAPGLGFLLMSCYAEQGELQLDVKSAPGQGTIITANYSDRNPVNE